MLKALVLGGSGYVGSAIVKRLAGAGADVAFSYFGNADRAETMARCHANAKPFRLDLRDSDASRATLREAIATLGGLDALVHAAAVPTEDFLFRGEKPGDLASFFELDAKGFDTQLCVGPRSAFTAVQIAAQAMTDAGIPGRIALVTGLNAVKAIPAPAHYAAAAGATRSMIEALAKTLGPHGITINAIAPGVLDGGVGCRLQKAVIEDYVKHCAVGRLGRADEVAVVVHWLLAENTYISGQTLVLDGGL